MEATRINHPSHDFFCSPISLPSLIILIGSLIQFLMFIWAKLTPSRLRLLIERYVRICPRNNIQREVNENSIAFATQLADVLMNDIDIGPLSRMKRHSGPMIATTKKRQESKVEATDIQKYL